MYNLIIAIIAIALMAAAASMAVYYGGGAYQQSQADMAATQMVQDAATIATAIRAWSADNGDIQAFPGTPDGTGTCRVSTTNLLTSGGYIKAIPGEWFASSAGAYSPGTWSIFQNGSDTCAQINVLVAAFGSNSTIASYGWPITGFPNSTKICASINSKQGLTTPPTYTASGYDFLTPMGNKQFACELDSAGNYYWFVYRVF